MVTAGRFPALWLLPALLPVALMTVYPVAHALWTSLHSVTLLFPDQPFNGLNNYRTAVTSNYFRDALTNSLVFTLFAAPLVVILGTLVALFLQRRFRGSQLVRSIVLLPWVLPGAISAVLLAGAGDSIAADRRAAGMSARFMASSHECGDRVGGETPGGEGSFRVRAGGAICRFQPDPLTSRPPQVGGVSRCCVPRSPLLR